MKKRILAIDDQSVMRSLYQAALDQEFDLDIARNGEDGLEQASSKQYDMVITDLNMPRVDGFNVIEQLRRDPNYKATPILVVSTENKPDKKRQAKELGASGWYEKPFNEKTLINCVNQLMGWRPKQPL